MWNELLSLIQLTQTQFLTAMGVILIAGIVRGFSGFALSALTMAGLTAFIAPIELIPICFIIEAAAGFMMFKGGIKDADMRIAWGLALTSAIGVPIGLSAVVSLPIETTKIIALSAILILTIAQLFKLKASFLATNLGLYCAGFTAGIATGLAHVGGMVVALYVLAQNAPARSMRGSLVMYLFITMFTSLVWHILFGTLDEKAIARGLLFIPFTILGVFLGAKLFRPSLEGFYKIFCLCLLLFLAGVSLVTTLS